MCWLHNHSSYSLRINDLQNTNKQRNKEVEWKDLGTENGGGGGGGIQRRSQVLKKVGLDWRNQLSFGNSLWLHKELVPPPSPHLHKSQGMLYTLKFFTID